MSDALATTARPGHRPDPLAAWYPLIRHLVTRFDPTGQHDDELMRRALAGFAGTMHAYEAQRGEFLAFAVPRTIRDLRRHRRARVLGHAAHDRAPDLDTAVVVAEAELLCHLRRSPTVQEIAGHLGVDEHDVILALEAGWPAASPAVTLTR